MKSLDELARSERLLVALDFDGTLAPIVPRPEMAEILPDAEAPLRELAGTPGTILAVVTGRDHSDVASRLPDRENFWIAGGHGRTLAPPGGEPAEPESDPRLDPFRKLSPPEGVRIERKAASIAFHWRGRAGGEPTDWLARTREGAQAAGLEVVPGRMVLEILSPGGSKEKALAEVARLVGATGVLYAGDDRTDLGAILWARRRGRGILVASGEVSFDVPRNLPRVEGPRDLAGVLSRLALLRARWMDGQRGQEPSWRPASGSSPISIPSCSRSAS